jgi:hypothetical protein
MVVALGVPINDLYRYGLLLAAAVAIFAGTVSRQRMAWFAAVSIVALAAVAQILLAAPRIEEGHNIFIVDRSGGALELGLPRDAFLQMRTEFDARYPVERRCAPEAMGCWRGQTFPDRAFAFSADGIYDWPAYSRRVTHIDFADPVWLRLGFINDGYNWGGASDLQRARRERGLGAVLHPWHLTVPFFVMYRFPADFVGSQLCWQGAVLWEGAEQRFARWQHAELACRPIEAADVGRRIFGVSIASPLAITLEPTLEVQLRRLVEPGLALVAVCAVLMLLVRWRERELALPFTLIGCALLVVLLNDASFIGGVRPFEDGEDGLVYETFARRITQFLLAGDLRAALEGSESVYYYGGPGLRYLRALERFVFGDSALGYLSLVLAMPFVVFAAFKRFLSPRAALGLTLIFLVIPIGALFGSTFFQYVKWAVRGYADPAAAIVFLGGLVMLVGRSADGPDARFAPAFGAGLLFALALWLRPNLAPGAAVLLGGAGLAALWQVQISRLTGLCLGFLPVFGMALHNWYFGGAFVLFSSNATLAAAIPMPPHAYAAAFGELLRLDLLGPNLSRGVSQWLGWLAGPSEFVVMAPLHAAAIVVLVWVMVRRSYDPWLRLIAAAALALHPVAWFYLVAGRYYYVAWFLTALPCAVFMRDELWAWLRRALPRVTGHFEHHPARARIERALDRLLTSAASDSRAAPPA